MNCELCRFGRVQCRAFASFYGIAKGLERVCFGHAEEGREPFLMSCVLFMWMILTGENVLLHSSSDEIELWIVLFWSCALSCIC